MTETGNELPWHGVPRYGWLEDEGSVVYNSMGADVATALESSEFPLPVLPLPSGDIRSVSLAMDEVSRRMAGHVQDVTHAVNPQSRLDPDIADRAISYIDPEAAGYQGDDHRRQLIYPLDVMVAEGLTTNIVLPTRLTLLSLARSGNTQDLNPQAIADKIDSVGTRSMLLTSARAGNGFWGQFVEANEVTITDMDEPEPADIDSISEAFVEKFSEYSKVEITEVDQLLDYDEDDDRVSFSPLALQIMDEYRQQKNERLERGPKGDLERTGDCPVFAGRIALESGSRLAEGALHGDYGPAAQQSLSDLDPDITDDVMLGFGPGSMQFSALIPRINTYLANTIRNID